MASSKDSFYLRFYSGHHGKYGHECLAYILKLTNDGKNAVLFYRNESGYRDGALIERTMCVSAEVVNEIKRIINESEIIKESDEKWPRESSVGKQVLEVRMGKEHKRFVTAPVDSLSDATKSADPEGLRVFYYVTQDLRVFVLSLIALHFKLKPI